MNNDPLNNLNYNPDNINNQPNKTVNQPVAPANKPVPPEDNLPKIKLEKEQVLGTIKPDKNKSPFAMIFLFSILVAAVIFMPTISTYISPYFDSYFHTDFSTNNTVTDTTTDETTDQSNENKDNTQSTDNKNNTVLFDIASSTTITLNDLSFSNFAKTNNVLTFNLTNNGSSAYSFTDKIYFDFYDANSTLIDRRLLAGTSIASKGTANLTLSMSTTSYTNSTKLMIVSRTIDDYPEVTLSGNALSCVLDSSEYDYAFTENKLTKLTSIYNYTSNGNSAEFITSFSEYKSKSEVLNKITGITSVTTIETGKFNSTTVYDLNLVDYQNIVDKTNLYPKDTLAKTIKFEMEGLGYTCR